MLRAKVVVALYPFRAIEGGDLSLEKVSNFLVRRIKESLLVESFFYKAARLECKIFKT